MAKVRTILYIQSSNSKLNIEDVSKILPFIPTKLRQKDTPMILNGVKQNALWRTSCWAYEYSSKELNDIKEELIPLLKILLPYKKQLIEIKDKLGFESYISIVISGPALPTISLDSFCLETLNELKLELDFDAYIGN